MAKRPAPAHAPYLPVPYEDLDAYALRALAKGEANEWQQKRTLDWIIRQAADTYGLSYRPESDRDTAFAEGRRFVGLQIVKLLNLPASVLGKKKAAGE